ncbi:restriction endonuclease subunit R, partial [bacterium]|nr:restriction endonuclease subunit R [bacterium]
ILTNGVTWWFYLPIKTGSWEQRKFYAIDFNSQDPEDVSERFFDFLSKDSVASGRASYIAEELLKSKDKERILNETMPKAWKKIISLPDETLVDLIADTTEEMCGHKPTNSQVKSYIKESHVKNISTQIEKRPYKIDEPKRTRRKNTGKYGKTKIRAFSFKGKRYEVRYWTDFIMKISEIIASEQGTNFEGATQLIGNFQRYFTRSPEKEENHEDYKRIPNTQYYVYKRGDPNRLLSIVYKLFNCFNYKESDLDLEVIE